MRDIKFRAFHEKEGICDAKKLHELDLTLCFDGDIIFANYAVQSNWKIMQFTGVKDCFELDIYEGDIVFLDSKMMIGEIVNDGISWRIKFQKDLDWLCDYENDLHVIGNIYEHPNLLLHGE